jgi:hypothetical protein
VAHLLDVIVVAELDHILVHYLHIPPRLEVAGSLVLFTDRFYSLPAAVSMATFDLKFVHQGRSQQVFF